VASRCEATRKDGSCCPAPATATGFCCFHDPSSAEARIRGGRNSHRPAATLGPDAPDLPLSTAEDVVGLLGATINQVRRGELDPKVGNCVAVLAGTLLKALEGGELARLLDELRRRVEAVEHDKRRNRAAY
jgi:hypothetical protein